jgi:hypothetical protein
VTPSCKDCAGLERHAAWPECNASSCLRSRLRTPGRGTAAPPPDDPRAASLAAAADFARAAGLRGVVAHADAILRAVGATVWLDDESLIDAVTAVSGSGPAYVFYFMEAMQKAAAELGFTPEQGIMTENVELAPGQSVPVKISYECRGTDSWRYAFADASRIRDFQLTLTTDFTDVNFPVSSPTDRDLAGKGMKFIWKYDDAISAPGIAIDMPRELNAGPVAAQIAFWSPLSLLLFFGVLVITVIVRGIRLHPVNYVFLAGGFFAFPLLFSYMLDIFPVYASFAIAAVVSLALVSGYLRAAAGEFMFRIALPAQFAYMVLFSASFFFKGLTGLTLTLGGISTLAVLMALTAKVDWSERLGGLSPKLA